MKTNLQNSDSLWRPLKRDKPKGKEEEMQTDLVEVGQTVWILAQALILSSQPISCCNLPELLQVHHVEGAVEPMAHETCCTIGL